MDLTSVGRGDGCAVKTNQRGTFQFFLGHHGNHKRITVLHPIRASHLEKFNSLLSFLCQYDVGTCSH